MLLIDAFAWFCCGLSIGSMLIATMWRLCHDATKELDKENRQREFWRAVQEQYESEN